jgi:hypothetical protein
MNPRSVQPELVEGLPFLFSPTQEGQAFDKLRLSGFGGAQALSLGSVR